MDRNKQSRVWQGTALALLVMMFLFAWMGSTVYLERNVIGPKLWSECVLEEWDEITSDQDGVQLRAIDCSDTSSEVLVKSVIIGAATALMIVLLVIAFVLIAFVIVLFFIDQHDWREVERKDAEKSLQVGKRG